MIELLTGDYPPLDWDHSRPGFTALIVVGLLFVAAALLVRSFLKHARRAQEPWEGEDHDDETR